MHTVTRIALLIIITVFLVLVGIETQAKAQIYRWTTPNGTAAFGHAPPPGTPYELIILPSEEILVLEERESEEIRPGRSETEERAASQAIMLDKAIFQQLVE
jgi:hypothetical protein